MITDRVKYSEAHNIIVKSFTNLPRAEMEGSWWSCAIVTDVRAVVKKHYVAVQNRVCCYCDRQQDSFHGRVWDVDHVVPKSTHPQFMFIPENLAASCVDCNSAKRDKQVLKNHARITYPDSASDFLIVHPHFDEYAAHVRHRGYIYVPKSKKGEFTIVTCRLLRFASEYMDWDDDATDRRFESDVDEILAEAASYGSSSA